MSAPYNAILQKCEQAMVALIGTQAAPVLGGRASLIKPAPVVICYAENAIEDFPGSGNYKVKLRVSVKTPAEPDGSTITFHEELCASVFDWCKDQTLAVDLTASSVTAGISDFCVQGAIDRGLSSGITPDSDAWIDSLELELYACATNLS